MATKKTAHPRSKKVPAANDVEESHGQRAVWKGAISFGLVQIPVQVLTAEKRNELHFHQLDKHDLAQVGYDHVNKSTGKKVEWADIVKGYEISKGEFVVVDDADFEKANVEATHTIDLQEFVDLDAVHPNFFEKPYFLIPDKRGEKPYAVLREALAKKKRAAVGLIVLRTRQSLCLVYAQEKGLVLEMLRFAHELLPMSKVEASLPKVSGASPKETALAERLVEEMTGKWEPEKYKDTYTDELLAAIKEKAETGSISAPKAAPKVKGATTDLFSLLQASLKSDSSAPKAKKSAGKAKSAA